MQDNPLNRCILVWDALLVDILLFVAISFIYPHEDIIVWSVYLPRWLIIASGHKVNMAKSARVSTGKGRSHQINGNSFPLIILMWSQI